MKAQINIADMSHTRPLVIDPLRLPHKHTFVLLHGRGSWGEKFGPVLLDTPVPETQRLSSTDTGFGKPLTFRTAFPHARFVFPTAPRRRATIYGRALTHQWFDNWRLDPPATRREELQIDGLRETTAYLHELLRAEIELVQGGAENVVLGGISQGCAASLIALLLWEGEKLGAAVGMCGWLPYAERLMEAMSMSEDPMEDDGTHDDMLAVDDIFARDDGFRAEMEEKRAAGPAARAVTWLREELDLAKSASSSSSSSSTASTPSFPKTPVFLGHGEEDDKVSVGLGRRASECLTAMQMENEVCSREYESLGHWYSGIMLRDLVDFILQNTQAGRSDKV